MENATESAVLDRKLMNIHDLPPELLAKIAEHADESDLPALQLSSKTLSCNAEIAFGVAFCTHRKHISSRHSLEGLIAIANHQAFGKYVRALSLGYSQLSKSRSPAEVAAIRQQDRFIESGECLRLLQEALSILYARRGESRHRAISLRIFEDKLKAAYGCRKAYEGGDVTCWNNSLMHAMDVMSKAAAATQIKVDNIDVIVPASFSYNGWEARWWDQAGFDDYFKDAILKVTRSRRALKPDLSFNITLDPTRTRRVTSKLRYGGGYLFVGYFKFGRYEGDLPCFNSMYLGAVPKILMPSFQPVRKLYLAHSVFGRGELQKLLRYLSPNLTRLQLWSVRLKRADDSWPDIIRWIGDHFTSLECFSIGRISSTLNYGDHSETFKWGLYEQKWHGEEVVRDSLAKAASDVEREEDTLESLYWAWRNRVRNSTW